MKILHEDDNIIVCVKPSGIATQSADLRSKDMVSLIKTHLVRSARKNKKSLNGEPYVGLIHRLDQPVAGILVFAKDRESAANLSQQVTNNQIKKYYYALVEGEFKDDKMHKEKKVAKDGTVYIEDEIVKIPGANAAIVNTPIQEEPVKRTKLEYKVIKSINGNTLIEVHLITGRFHQIRATMSYIGNPIVGDVRYGARDKLPKGAIALCCYKLCFKHPITNKDMSFVIEP